MVLVEQFCSWSAWRIKRNPARAPVWVRPVLRFRSAEQHVQEVAGIAQIIVRIDERHAQRVTVGKRCDRRHFADQPVSLLLARLRAEDVFGIRD